MFWLYEKLRYTVDTVALDLDTNEWTIVALALIVVGSICMRGHANNNF